VFCGDFAVGSREELKGFRCGSSGFIGKFRVGGHFPAAHGVGAVVIADCSNVCGRFLNVSGDFLTVNGHFSTVDGHCLAVNANFFAVGGDCWKVNPDGLNVSAGCAGVNMAGSDVGGGRGKVNFPCAKVSFAQTKHATIWAMS
jgi:hypothetical protein